MISEKKRLLRQLTYEWDLILAATGFRDIEKTLGDERVLTQFASNCYRQADELTRESKQRYFDLIAEKTHTHSFESTEDKHIMTRWAEGWEIKKIVEEFLGLGKRIHRQTIRYKIRRYENAWGIKVWSYKQMNLKPPIK